MRIQILVAGVCAAAFIPVVALAQQTCEQRQSNRVAGTIVGAGVGAVAGGAVAGRDDRGKGAVIGGVAGALIGNQVAKGQAAKGREDCARAYGFYDNQGSWHANAVSRGEASGYFDRNGEWVDGAPRGHYGADGRWMQASTDAGASGYYANGLWVPASAAGYYAQDGRWMEVTSGHYDGSGRWVAGAATGRYDADGRWMPGQAAGRRAANGTWISDPQPGYYDNGRWVRGETVGYYDARGSWVSTDARRSRADYVNGQYPDGRGMLSIDDRQAQLAERINRGASSGRLSRAEAGQATRTLAAIERQKRSLRNRQGNLGPKGRAIITARLDRLSDSVSGDIRNDR